MSEWREMALGDLGRVVTGKTPSTSVSDYFGGDVPFVTPSDMFGHKVISRTARSLTKAGVATVKGSFIPKGSVMVSCIGSDMGKVTIAAHDCVSNQQINSIVVCENFSADFIYYNLSTRKAELQSMACSGSAQPILNKGHFSQLPISLPPLSEQRAIAAVLGSLDDKIELNRRMNETLEALAQSLFKSWFVDATQSALPKGWRSETIDNVCSVVTRGVTPKYQEGSGRFIINQRVNRGFELDWSEMKELESDLEVPPAKFARQWDVLVNSLGEGTLGRTHLYLDKSDVFAVDQHMSICRPKTPAVGIYLYQILSSADGQAKIESLKTGSTGMTMFNISKLREFDFVYPTDELLEKYFKAAESVFLKIVANRQESRTVAALRDALLPKLLSGELRVPVAAQLPEARA